MRALKFGICLLAAAPFVFGQLDTDSLTISATRTFNLQPDQGVLGVYVDSAATAGLSDVLAALQGSGITADNLTRFYTPDPFMVPPRLRWQFTLTTPLSKMRDTIVSLAALQMALAQQNSGLALTFNIQGTQVSAQSQAVQQCRVENLLADARAQAQKLADAIRVSVGPVLAMSTATFTALPIGYVPYPVAVIGVLGSSPYGAVSTSVSVSCSLIVKFSLAR